MAGQMMNMPIIPQWVRRATLLLVTGLSLAACNGPANQTRSEPPLAGASLGGPFTLVDQYSKTRKDSEFAGQYRIVYFGYSFCPDVCPVDLQKLMRGLAQFEKQDPERGKAIAPLFITVDPERDTPEALAPFVARYHPRLLGLTGTPEQIAAVAKAYAVSYHKVEGSAPDRYLMAHTQMAFLMGPKGEPLALLPIDDPTTPDKDEGAPDAVAADLARWVH
jgi:protein SCO1